MAACTICYNDYCSKSPEGTVEHAVRIPGCDHVFGHLCVRRWLEDSDCCPYCRHKLPSEPRPSANGHTVLSHIHGTDNNA